MNQSQRQPQVINKGRIVGFVVALIAIIFIACIPKIYEDVENDKIVVNQHLWSGEMEYWTTPGAKAQYFGNLTEYYKTQQLWFGSTDDKSEQNGNPIPVIFNDASDGRIYGSLRVKLPTDPKFLARIQTDYNGMDRLMNDLVRPTVTKVIYASGPLMSAFESYAEKKNDLIEHITNQLNNGVYRTSVKRVVAIDPISGEEKTINIATLIPDSLSAGGYKRSEPSPFAYYGLEVGQVAVSKIDYSEKVTQQISQQQEANMLIQTSKAKAAAAQQESVRAQAEGEAKAMTAKWEQEKVKAVEVTKAEQEFEVAKFAALRADEEAKKILAEGKAQAEANRLKVAAGLTPLEKANIEKETAIGVARELKSLQLPTYVNMGGGGSTTFQDAVGMNMVFDLMGKIQRK